MIDGRTISVTLTAALLGWLLAVGMFAAAVVLFVVDGGRVPILVAQGACIMSAAAGTAHIKHFSQQVCTVVRDRDQLAVDVRRLQSMR